MTGWAVGTMQARTTADLAGTFRVRASGGAWVAAMGLCQPAEATRLAMPGGASRSFAGTFEGMQEGRIA